MLVIENWLFGNNWMALLAVTDDEVLTIYIDPDGRRRTVRRRPLSALRTARLLFVADAMADAA